MQSVVNFCYVCVIFAWCTSFYQFGHEMDGFFSGTCSKAPRRWFTGTATEQWTPGTTDEAENCTEQDSHGVLTCNRVSVNTPLQYTTILLL